MSALLPGDRLHARLGAFQRRVARAHDLIARALAQMQQPYVAWSGGKDSTVVLALGRVPRPDIPAIWFDDELEYPETVTYLTETAAALAIDLRPMFGTAQHGGWFTPWTDRPFWRESLPGTARLGPDYGAREGWDGGFIGLRAQERPYRAVHLRARGVLYQTSAGQWRCNPIADWSLHDVWAYLAQSSMPSNPVYDRLTAIDIPRELQRVGPLPLTPGWILAAGWPDLYRKLVTRYGMRW
ncbi:MAG: phosphoadenosine phosphosulfate reductase family protein [Dehalococcoidia bacterium]